MGGAVSSGSTNDELIDNLVDGACIRTRDVERAFRMVDRAEYFLPRSRNNAYKDVAWKSGHYHLSAPCVYSEVMEGLCLKPGNSFLNIGSGTGYLSTMAGLLLGTNGINHGIEIHEDLVEFARHKLERFKKFSGALDEFEFCEPYFAVGNGLCMSHGKLGDFREYDRVYCGAACPEAFEAQVWRLVAVGGILVMPCNDQLLQLRRTAGDRWDACPLLGVTFATLVPPLSDVEYTEQERKEHLRIAMTLFTVTPPSLQHLCRSLIRTTLRANITQSHPNLYKPARKPTPNPKSSRRIPRPTTTTTASTNAAAADEPPSAAAAATTGTQRVTLSLGSNGRLSIDRSGVETEATARARARLLAERLINARNNDVEGGGGRMERRGDDNEAFGRCAALEGAVERDRTNQGGTRDLGPNGRRALSEAVGNHRMERLLEHLCQEMILEPTTADLNQVSQELRSDTEESEEDNQRDSTDSNYMSDSEMARTLDVLFNRQRTEENSHNLDKTNDEQEKNAASSTSTKSENCTSKKCNSASTSQSDLKDCNEIAAIIHESDGNEGMETDSEKENLTETENVTVELNPTTLACTCTDKTAAPQTVDTNTTCSSNSELNSIATSPLKGESVKNSTGETINNKMEIDQSSSQPATSNSVAGNVKKRLQRFRGHRPRKQSEGSTSTKSAPTYKRSYSNSSLSKSSKRSFNYYIQEDSTTDSDGSLPDTVPSSSEEDEEDFLPMGGNRLGRPAQIVHLYDITSRLEANNNLADISTETDEDSDDHEESDRNYGDPLDETDTDDQNSPLMKTSEYTQFMIDCIKLLPLPKRLMVYINCDRSIEDEDNSDKLKRPLEDMAKSPEDCEEL